MNTVKLPWPPKELSPNNTAHWSKKSKYKKQYRLHCWILSKESKLIAPADGKIKMKVTFFPPDKRHRDADNMVASIKSGLDGVADALQVNDKRFLPMFIFSEEVKGMVEIEIQ